MPSTLPSSPACLRNRAPILEVLKPLLGRASSVLEIGAGTGEHAAFFIPALPQLRWQATGLPAEIDTLRARLNRQATAAPEPVILDVNGEWPRGPFDAVYTANTCHIMAWPSVQQMIRGAAQVLRPGGSLIVYGPFKENGRHTGPGNRRFHASLRARDPDSGIRDLTDLESQARNSGFTFQQMIVMPADNRLLVWNIDQP